MPTKLILTYNNKKINTAPAPALAPAALAPAALAPAAPAPTPKAAVMSMNRNIKQPISMRTIIRLPASNCSACGN